MKETEQTPKRLMRRNAKYRNENRIRTRAAFSLLHHLCQCCGKRPSEYLAVPKLSKEQDDPHKWRTSCNYCRCYARYKFERMKFLLIQTLKPTTQPRD